MKFCILFALALLGAVNADVAHVNNMYLPPYMMKMFHQNIDYAEQVQEIPKVSQVEISDNSVVSGSDEPAAEQHITTGQMSIQELNNGLTNDDNVETHTEEKHYETSKVYSSGHDDSASKTETSAPASHSHTSSSVTTVVEEVAKKTEPDFSSRSSASDSDSDDSTQKHTAHSDSDSSTSTTTDTKTEEVTEEKEKKKSYLELLGPTVKPSEPAPDHDEETDSVHSEVHETAAVAKSAPTPGSDIITQKHSTVSTSTSVSHEEEEAAVPAVSSRSSEIDTKYGSNGGYVY